MSGSPTPSMSLSFLRYSLATFQVDSHFAYGQSHRLFIVPVVVHGALHVGTLGSDDPFRSTVPVNPSVEPPEDVVICMRIHVGSLGQ